MTQRLQLPEQEFLKLMVVREFNNQTSSNINWEKTIIYSVNPVEGYKHCYEINTNVPGDTIRLHLYLNVGESDLILPYSLEVRPVFQNGVLGDEVYVFRGNIDTAHILYGGYKLPWIGKDITQLPVLLQTDGEAFRLVDDSFIALVG